MEWAVQAKTQSSEVVNHTVRLLGRQGILDATAVAPYQAQAAANLVPLKDLVKNISFNRRVTPTISKVNKFPTLDSPASSKVMMIHWLHKRVTLLPRAKTGWVGLVCVSRCHRRRRRHAGSRSGATTSQRASRTFNRFSRCEQRYWRRRWTCPGICGRGSGGTRLAKNDLPTDPVKANAVKPGGLKPEAAVTQNGSNGSSNGSTHRRGARRKKIFDYHRFYTDTVMKLSSSGYTAAVPPRNGHTNGHSDGHSSAPAMEVQPASYGAMNQAIVQSHLDLIANQKVLIEEQKRLVQEQTKLIEEKNKFIQEQNELLDRQTAMIDQYSLKLD